MPCCCSSNIKAAKILGIILAVLYGFGIVNDFTKPLTKGHIFTQLLPKFFCVASALILAYGGFTRNSKAMKIYIYSTIFLIILFIAGAVWGFVEYSDEIRDEIANAKEAGPIGVIFVVVSVVATILFYIWTIFVAKNAKKEIEAEI